jgi:hypothetical protein
MAHSIIPHHHCDEVTNNGTPCTRMPDEPSRHSGRLPWHCQAVNHLVLIEQQLAIKFKAFHLFHFDMLINRNINEITLTETVIIYYILPSSLSLNKPFLTHQVLRGPPSFS